MNKIILFVIVLIIGSVLSTSMMEVPKEKVTDTTFECTIKSIKHCGTSDAVCLKKFMKNCQTQTTTEQTTINASHVNHKKHHTYKTSIIVKEDSYDDEEAAKRICITDTNCNCKDIAKTACEKSEDSNCYDDNLNQCQTRCRESRRCYRMDCRHAGKTRCNRDVQLECALKHPESTSDRISCVQKKSSCCLKYEKATCQRALRVYKFRSECNTVSQTKCQGITDSEEKCSCVSKTRHTCLVDKVEKHKQSIRQVFNCDESASLICSEKKCGADYDVCVKKEKSICEPVCEKESRIKCNNQVNGVCYQQTYKTCVHKWKRNYCEKRAEIKCGDNDDCLRAEKHICKRDIPSCMTGEVSCDDKNKCTEDICHPTQGCINKLISCDDNNACTTESCDPLLGCVYRTKKCDDGKLCTRDTCNPVTGQCKYVYDNTICHVCGNGYCEKDEECAAYEKSAKLAESCQKAVCDAETGSCKAVHVKGCAHKCRKSCQPYHACDVATCVLNKKSNEYECVHTDKVCDDHKSCTSDSCDRKLGCQHKLNKEVCPENPLCENDSECLTWETSKNLRNKCQKAVCDKHKGICLAVSTSQECDESVCRKTCQPRHACETAQCQKNKDGRFHCAKQPIVCDDKKECTVDTCDDKLGCVFKFRANEYKCRPGPCEHNADCKKFELTEKLAERCLRAVCDVKLGACTTAPVDGPCDKELKDCELNCKTSNQCQRSFCAKEGGRYTCKKEQTKTCDDGLSCTVDTCDEKLGCVHTYKPNEIDCPIGGQCKRDAECVTWGFTQKLGKQCKRAVCDLKTGACKAVPKEKKCTTIDDCQLKCKAQNACETAKCELNGEGDYYCKRVSKTCDDNNECTIDTCDVTSGQCVFTQVQSEKCTNKCTKQSDCEALNKKVSEDCKSAVCDLTTQRCNVVPTTDAKCFGRNECRKTCVARSKCEVATCVYDETNKKHTCKRTPSNDSTCKREKDCELECKPANLCETTKCSALPDGSFTCLRSENTCNDNKSCTKDSCDKTTGKCVNTYVVSDKCLPGAYCEKNLDCTKWANLQELDACLTPVCDNETGSCKAVPNARKCSSRICLKECPPRNACEESTCAYDRTTKKLVCEYNRKSCDDKNRCTRDSCDEVKGCVNVFDSSIPGCDTPRCETPKDCVKYAQDNKLADDCKDAICDSETKTCRSVLINNDKCNPYLNKCRRECAPRDACETAVCIVESETKRYRCSRNPITCNDNNACTVDVCDKVKGCKYTYTISDKCEQYCADNNDCTSYGIRKQASLSCQVPYCDKTTSSCRLQADPNKNCKPVDKICEENCKPKDACHTARCVRKGEKEFTCVQESIKCDDGQSCTEDSCDSKKGCQFTFKESKTCRKPCKVDIDCDNWAVTEKLADKCQKARCSRKLGSCVAIKGVQTEKCKNDQCKLTSDCPQGRFGSVCCEENGVRSCCENQCETDLDCVPKDKKKEWGYCRVRESGKRECEFKEKCTGNEGCDDKNPCTKDVCMVEYGFCKNIRRCVDNSECTHDICEAGSDGKTYTCKNPVKTCTNDKTLLDKNYELLTPEQKTKWLGKCSHLEGCITCVVNKQCDDNNGCTEDSCINQFCVSKPIDNKWCDPKLKGQAITVQGYFPKFTRL